MRKVFKSYYLPYFDDSLVVDYANTKRIHLWVKDFRYSPPYTTSVIKKARKKWNNIKRR